jgi:hypothetical protein
MIALRFLTQTLGNVEHILSQSANTDLELVSTLVVKALVHDVKITALPMPYQAYSVIHVALDLYNELLSLETFRPELEDPFEDDL